MNVLVTGGAGYIGSHAARALKAAGHDVVVFDDLSTGHRKAARRLPAIVRERHRRRGAEGGDEAFSSGRGDALRRQASSASPSRTRRSTTANNVAGGVALLEAMRACGREALVFSSARRPSTASPSATPIDRGAPHAADRAPTAGRSSCSSRCWPTTPRAYGLALRGPALLQRRPAPTRAATIGEDHDPETHLIPLVLQAALGQRAPVTVFGTDYPTPDGTCIRDYIHVDDLAAAHVLALETARLGGGLRRLQPRQRQRLLGAAR